MFRFLERIAVALERIADALEAHTYRDTDGTEDTETLGATLDD